MRRGKHNRVWPESADWRATTQISPAYRSFRAGEESPPEATSFDRFVLYLADLRHAGSLLIERKQPLKSLTIRDFCWPAVGCCHRRIERSMRFNEPSRLLIVERR